jgi:hypothetical protein
MATAIPIEQEVSLPPDIVAMGRPLQVHREKAALSPWLLLFGTGLFLLVMAVVFLFIYWKVPMKKDDVAPPEIMLYIAGGLGLVGACLSFGTWCKGSLETRKSVNAYLIYPQALVLLQEGAANVIRWNEITELISPRNFGDYKIATRDGRSFPIKRAVEDYSNLISTVISRASDEVVGPAVRALEAGETVTFGPFAVSQEALHYKGKTLPWERVAALEVQVGQAGRRLRIRASGSLLPWCYANLESFPNGMLLPQVLRHVCPERLLARY